MKSALFSLAAALLLSTVPAIAADWRELDPDNTLVIDTTKGRIVIEMRPEFAPNAVARIKLLSREHVYDGLLFHRVIDHFVDQTGNPNNHDGGKTAHPNLAPEFMFKLKTGIDYVTAGQNQDGLTGFVGATPFQGTLPTEAAHWPGAQLRGWGAHCPGVVGMGRDEPTDSANSEIYFMRDASRRLDHDYTVWGRIIWGLDVARALNIGEPPANPDKMVRVRVMADLPANEQPHVRIAGPETLKALIAQTRAARGPDFSVCDVEVPVEVAP